MPSNLLPLTSNLFPHPSHLTPPPYIYLMKRRDFIKAASPIVLLLANGKIVEARELGLEAIDRRKVILRFVVASDGHYGQPNTPYQEYFTTLVNRINEEHARRKFAFAVINGDIIHDDKTFCPAAKAALDRLQLKYYVSQGNHDMLTPVEWQATWQMPINLDFKIKKSSFLIASTSNAQGIYLCPDLDWMRARLEAHRHQDRVFIFIHINPAKLTRHAVDCPELYALFDQFPNVKAVFNGHDHDEEGIKMKGKIPFVFDAHFGGSWGTEYRGFRIVEVLKDGSIATYILNPVDRIREEVI